MILPTSPHDQPLKPATPQDSERTLQQIIDSLPVIVVWKDRNSTYQGCNQALLGITGFEQVVDIVGKTDYDMPWTKEEADWFVQCDRRIMDADEPELNIIEPQRQADGKQAWLSTSKIPLHSADGLVSGILVMVEDITDRKAAEDKLAQSEEKFRSIVESVSDLIYVHDVEGKFSYLSPRIEDMLGYRVEEMVGQSFMPYVHPDDVSGYVEAAQSVFATGKKVTGVEFRGLRCDGRWCYLSANLAPHHTEGNAVSSVISTVRDITAEKEAAAQLQAYADQQALLNQLTAQIRKSLDVGTILQTTLSEIRQIFNLDMAVFAWMDTTTEPMVWYLTAESASPGIASVLGEIPSGRMGPIEERLMHEDVIAIDQVSHYEEPVHRQFMQEAGAESCMLATVRTKKDVGVIICNAINQPHHWKPSEIALVKLVADQLAIAVDQAQLYEQSRQQSQQLSQTLSQLQKTQAQMIQTEKMSGLGQMVAGIAHEINNPVNFIHANLGPASGYVNDLLKVIDLYQKEHPTPSQDLNDVLEDIEFDFIQTDFVRLMASMKIGTERIRKIVLSLRNFSRVDEAEIKTVDLHEGLESTLVILAHRLKATDQRKEIEIVKDYGKLPLVDCYPGQLNQVFMNILSNAIDALSNVAQPQITISTAIEAGRITIQINDNGSGIPDAIQETIFNPFFTTKPVGKGTGMGLSISYQIITEKHKGELSVSSIPKEGTTFKICLP